MQFKERTTVPSKDNKYYIHTTFGGYNKCITRDKKNGNVLPNCVGYSYGRFMECAGVKTTKLSRANAEDWWGYNDGYERGQEPRVGAVICWRSGKTKNGKDGAGHVASVEKVNADGSIVISQSNYSGTVANGRYFQIKTLKKPYKLTGKTLQGFIYNPTKFDNDQPIQDWTPGKYKLLYNKCIRKTHRITPTNIVKAQNCTPVTKKHLVSKTGNAKLKAGTTITCKEIVKDGNRLFGSYGNAWICIRNKDLTPQAEKVS